MGTKNPLKRGRRRVRSLIFKKAKKSKYRLKMAELTKAQLIEKIENMKSIDGVMDTILELSAEDTRKIAIQIKTTQKGINVHTAILYGMKRN
jgi:hypothetical protein